MNDKNLDERQKAATQRLLQDGRSYQVIVHDHGIYFSHREGRLIGPVAYSLDMASTPPSVPARYAIFTVTLRNALSTLVLELATTPADLFGEIFLGRWRSAMCEMVQTIRQAFQIAGEPCPTDNSLLLLRLLEEDRVCERAHLWLAPRASLDTAELMKECPDPSWLGYYLGACLDLSRTRSYVMGVLWNGPFVIEDYRRAIMTILKPAAEMPSLQSAEPQFTLSRAYAFLSTWLTKQNEMRTRPHIHDREPYDVERRLFELVSLRRHHLSTRPMPDSEAALWERDVVNEIYALFLMPEKTTYRANLRLLADIVSFHMLLSTTMTPPALMREKLNAEDPATIAVHTACKEKLRDAISTAYASRPPQIISRDISTDR